MTSVANAHLAGDRRRARQPLALTMSGDGRRAGAVSSRIPGGFRRAEQGRAGPLVVEVRLRGGEVITDVWGPPGAPAVEVERALHVARRWAGLEDDLADFAELVDANPTLRRLRLLLPPPILGALPRAAESFGRAVLGQLVQGVEAKRSTAQLVAMLGTPTPVGLWAWPTRRAIGATPAHQLRRCGIALRSARALHAMAVEEPRFERLSVTRGFDAMDRALRRIPGVGPWTSAETRLYLGDADAVSVGDYHLPALVGWVLGDRSEDDEAMLELLEPFRPHRGRVQVLLERAAAVGLVRTKPRRGPRARLSAHRYW